VADVATESQCRGAVDQTLAHFGRIDILVNNVGITGDSGRSGRLEHLTKRNWDRVMAVNVTSMAMMTKYSARAMTDSGAIVNVSSVGVRRPAVAAYSSSKGAVEALTRVMALELGQRGIRANAVAPGHVWTEMVARHETRTYPDAAERGSIRQRKRSLAVLPREGTAWDIAHAIGFLVSDDASWITGQVLTVDGGALLAT
jgi:NAD(P)-dependent dehydrogenase (short-subunit alcohol dehydrogenase family)